MWGAIKGILRSKKAVAALVAALAGLAGRIGWDVPASELALMLSPIIAFVVGQSIADHGAQGGNSANAPTATP